MRKTCPNCGTRYRWLHTWDECTKTARRAEAQSRRAESGQDLDDVIRALRSRM